MTMHTALHPRDDLCQNKIRERQLISIEGFEESFFKSKTILITTACNSNIKRNDLRANRKNNNHKIYITEIGRKTTVWIVHEISLENCSLVDVGIARKGNT